MNQYPATTQITKNLIRRGAGAFIFIFGLIILVLTFWYGSRQLQGNYGAGLERALAKIEWVLSGGWVSDETPSTESTTPTSPTLPYPSNPKESTPSNQSTQINPSLPIPQNLTYPLPTTLTEIKNANDSTSFIGTVREVVDGDTIEVKDLGLVRLIGINAPESSGPYRKTQCFGSEAGKFLQQLIDNQTVIITTDPSQDFRDRFGRILAYAIRGKDLLYLNEHLVRQGYAYEYTYRTPYQSQRLFKSAQKEAEQAQRGLWSPQACT